MGDLPTPPGPASLDARVRRSLAKWPQRPPGMPRNIKQPGTWLRARPDNWTTGTQPFLKLPGSRHLRTLPDGLWLHFSHDPGDPYADILCIEACASLTNLLGLSVDKTTGQHGAGRMAVAGTPAGKWVFPIDEIYGIYLFNRDDVKPAPVVITNADHSYACGVFQWQNRSVALLDPDRIFSMLTTEISPQ